jgi:hypothetical protein
MKPGAGRRIYRDGYLAGLREALEILADAKQADPSSDYQPEQAHERTLAEDTDAAYEPGGDDKAASGAPTGSQASAPA